MRHMINAALATAVLLAASGMTWAEADNKTSGTLKMKYDPRGASRARTPAWASGRNRFSVGSSSSMGIKVAGTQVRTSARTKGRRVVLGFDRNGDGKLSAAEWVKLTSTTMHLSGKAGGKPYVIRLVKLYATVNKATVNCWGQALIRSCMRGTLSRIPVRIMDDDMDGQFTQNGQDAILIGKSSTAVPLKEVHRIGKKLYRIKVLEDGSSIDYELMPDTPIGQVRAVFPANTLKSLVLVSKDGAFDVKKDGVAGIPGGRYKLSYGVVSRSSATLTFRPGRTTPDYDIQDGMINTLRMGKPVRLHFGARYAKSRVQLSANAVRIVGSGSEIYGPLAFAKGGNVKPPKISWMRGSRVISSSKMEYG